MNLHNAFHQHAYAKVLSHNLTQTSSTAYLPARVLQLRARIALGQQSAVLADIAGEEEEEEDAPDLAAVKALALYTSNPTTTEPQSNPQALGLALAEKLAAAATTPTNAAAQILAATVLAAANRTDEALALLSNHQGTLEAAALITQLHLLSNRTDLAQREVAAAKKWAQDSLLINIAESWVGLRVGGERYQQAVYEFEDMPLAQGVGEVLLGRWDEALVTLGGLLVVDGDGGDDGEGEGKGGMDADADVLANLAVVEGLMGRRERVVELLGVLGKKMPGHALLAGLEEKGRLFDEVAARYSPKVALTA